MIALAFVALALAPPDFSAPVDTALVTYESGVPVAADWIQRRGAFVHTRSVLMQSGIRDAVIELGADGTALHASTRVGNAGGTLGAPIERDLGPARPYWSDQIPSSIAQVIARARALGRAHATIPGASLYRDAATAIEVERVDATDWVLRANGKRYDVLTDDAGNVVSATLPDYGVVIERRLGFPESRYPLWAAYAAAPGAPYTAEEVRVPAPQGHVLAGTLTRPRGTGPFAAAVLVTGLSPHERNNGEPPWMPLRDVADAMSRRGIVVLRVDDRGVGASTGDRASSTTFDEADDVRTEIAWLRKRRDVDRRSVAIVGYSEGGLIAPIVAASDSTVAAVVTMAGPGVAGMEVARYQIEAAVVRDTSIAPAAREAEIAKQLADTLTVREQSYLAIADPLVYARRVHCPALILQGGSDLHVPVRSAGRIAAAMRAGGNRDVTVRIFPGVSHAFLPDPLGLSSGWAALPAFLTSPAVLQAIGEWADSRLRATARARGRARQTPGR